MLLTDRSTLCLAATCLIALACDTTVVADQASGTSGKPTIPRTTDGINEFLHSLSPDAISSTEKHRLVTSLINQLGDASFQTRERAHHKLATLTDVPAAVLKKAAESNDPEVRWRAKLLVKQTESRDRRFTVEGLVEAVARIVASSKIEGVNESLFQSLEYIDDERSINAISTAILATATESDLPRINTAISHSKSEVRKIGVATLAKVAGSDRLDQLMEIAQTDSSPDVQMAAAIELAKLGHRPVIAELIRMLRADDVQLRSRAVRVLRGLTHHNFKFIAYVSEDKRSKAIDRWTKWWDGPGKSEELAIPLKLEAEFVGKILIADYGRNQVTEVDLDGKELWTTTVKHAWDCQGLPNGHRVVSSYSERRVVEFDADGNEVWEQKNIPGNAMGFHRLENGNTLVACSTANKVIEYSRDNRIVWEAKITGRPVDVQRLENGNTLVALEQTIASGNRVVEVDVAGEIVWSLKNNSPLTVERLDNGNTLIGSAGNNDAVEIGPTGDVVWSHKMGEKCTVARRLPNGDTLVGTHKSLSAIRTDGSVRWKVDGMKYCYGASPY